MAIKRADEIDRSESPRCPECGTIFSPTGLGQPYAVDDHGRVYCRRHGNKIEPDYDRALVDYESRRKAMREVSDALFKNEPAPSKEEMNKIREEWK